MTAGLDEHRPDHTRPTIAFIVLAVAAAAVMTAGMTTNRPETPIAADRPPRITPVVPAPPAASATSEPAAFPEFSMADVVTLAAAEVEPRPERRRKPRAGDAGSAPPRPARSVSPPPVRNGATPDTRSDGGAGTRSGSGGGDATGSTAGGSAGSGGQDTGPGRSTTGQGKARGQKDTSPGRDVRSGQSSGRTTARTTGRR